MKALLKQIIDNSNWTYPAYDGKLIIKGRILSPIESQTVGIAAALIASGIARGEDLALIQKINDEKDVTEENADDLFKALKNFDADKILKMADNQDNVLVKCIYSGSMDEGKTWNDFRVVLYFRGVSGLRTRLRGSRKSLSSTPLGKLTLVVYVELLAGFEYRC